MLLAIVDTETTGLKGDVIEIAAILYDSTSGVMAQCSTVLPFDENPAEHINGIPPRIGAMAEYLQIHEQSLDLISSWLLMAEAIVAHNGAFDLERILATELLAEVHPYVKRVKWIDTCRGITWPKQFRNGQKLIDLALAHGLGVATAHRAMADCDLIARLFDQMRLTRSGNGTLLDDLIQEGLTERIEYKALVNIESKDLAKDAGFRWDPERRGWFKELTEGQVRGLKFRVSAV